MLFEAMKGDDSACLQGIEDDSSPQRTSAVLGGGHAGTETAPEVMQAAVPSDDPAMSSTTDDAPQEEGAHVDSTTVGHSEPQMAAFNENGIKNKHEKESLVANGSPEHGPHCPAGCHTHRSILHHQESLDPHALQAYLTEDAAMEAAAAAHQGMPCPVLATCGDEDVAVMCLLSAIGSVNVPSFRCFLS